MICSVPGCNKKIKPKLVERMPGKKLVCYYHWCLMDKNNTRPEGRNPRARKENKANKTRRCDEK